MNPLDIIIICLGATAVIIYGVISILKYNKDRKKIGEYINKGYTYEEAKALVKKERQKGKKHATDQDDDDFAE